MTVLLISIDSFLPLSLADDSCHYPQTSDLREYVLNAKGRIWVGSSRSNYGRPWQFSQFSKDSLEVALWILDQMKGGDRADPVKVKDECLAVNLLLTLLF